MQSQTVTVTSSTPQENDDPVAWQWRKTEQKARQLGRLEEFHRLFGDTPHGAR